MDINAMFGMEYNPFRKTRNMKHIETSEFREVQARLRYLQENHGFGLISGESGRGKTTAVREWARSLNPAMYKVVYISISTLTSLEFYRKLSEELNCVPAFRKVDNYRNIQEAINRYVLEKKITPVIILDEANYLSNTILNDLKMIFNFEMDSRERAVGLLVGLPQLNNILRLSAHEPLRQRLVMNYHMEGLSIEESKDYIRIKLIQAGCHEEVFDENALQAISNGASGIPRMIDNLCSRCLLIAEKREQYRINADIAMAAINDSQLG